MRVDEVVGRINKEEIYRHVLRLEGSRESLDSPERLDAAANYIRSEFEKHGLSVHEHTFKVEGLDRNFRNVDATTSADDGLLFLSSHYDTVRDCPGADDNASGVAVMLEVGRVLAEEGISGVRFVSFTLEEQDPVTELRRRDARQRLGLTDEKHRFTSAHTNRTFRLLRQFFDEGYSSHKLHEQILEARKKYEAELTPHEAEYLRTLEQLYKEREAPRPLGSSRWVQEALPKGKELKGLINLEMIGYASDREHSQYFPKGMNPGRPPFDFVTHKVKDFSIGNYLFLFGNATASSLLEAFCAQGKLTHVDLPYSALHLPFPYKFIEANMPDLLRADHAPFWRAEMPALFLTDSANFRNPYYHTQADTIDKLDFDFMTKVAKATLATIIQLRTGNRLEVASA